MIWAVEKWTSNQPPPEVFELTSQSVMDVCTNKQLCFISFLPHILDSGASGRNDYIATATAVGKYHIIYRMARGLKFFVNLSKLRCNHKLIRQKFGATQ